MRVLPVEEYPDATVTSSLSSVSEEESLEMRSVELGLGSPKCRATVTVSSSAELDKVVSSFPLFMSTSMAVLQEDSCSSYLVGPKLRRGRASLRGGEGGE